MNHSTLRFNTIVFFVVLLMGIYTSETKAQIQTAGIFTNGMVLQRGLEIPVWGSAGASDTVIVTLNTASDTAIADESGKWQAILPAMSAGGPDTMTVTNGSETITRTNVYIGDVWLASGQSNMAMKLSESTGGATEIASANNQTIRQFQLNITLGAEPVDEVPAGSAWTPATSAYAGNFTAVGYYFAKDLQPEIGVPIGIINTSVGGARIETYMSEEMLGFDETYVILANGEPERQATVAFNTLINPLINFPIKGVIWYQGESNADNMEDAIAYSDLFKRMIIGWRELWGLGDIPFLWVQLPNHGTPAVESTPGTWDAWPKLRAGQSRALSLSNTGEATTIDVGDVDIHPKDKVPVGYRLSLVARKVAYGEDIVYSGPRYKNHSLLDEGHVKIRFDHVGSGLVAKDAVNDSVHWFSMAGSNETLYSADAILDGDSVVVWSDSVPEPTTIRYAWEYNPENTNLYNAEDLPAVPFLIRVNNPFEISSFTATSSLIERGKSVVLAWETHGASSTTLNNQPVDSIDGVRVWPLDTTTYILRTINQLDENVKDSASITIQVTEPMPTITIKSDLGDLVPPDSTVIISATVFAPGGGTIAKVEFYVDDVLLSTDTESPFEAEWTPSVMGEYTITGVVTDGNDNSVESIPLVIVVANLILVKYEAEDASFTGSGTIKNSSLASSGKYVDLTDGWVLTFSNVNVPDSDEYNLNIRYLLNYQSPKTQNLLVNGLQVSSIIFTAPNTSTWMTYRIKVRLNEGDNEIVIQGSWNWMSFDYIGIPTEAPPVELNDMVNSELSILQNSPNPFDMFTDIAFMTAEAGFVTLGIYSVTGEQVALLLNENKPAGKHIIRFEAGQLPEGVYFVMLKNNGFMESKKILIVR
jgi:sialate O-acetylesterase